MRPSQLRRLRSWCLAGAALLAAACGSNAAREAGPSTEVAQSAPAASPAPAPALELRDAGSPAIGLTSAAQPTADSAAAPEPAPAAPTGSGARSRQAASSPAEGQAANPAAMLIRTGTASVEVDSLDAAVARVQALAARLGGYVGNTSLAGGRDQVRSATLELKLPVARFQEALAGLAPLGRVDSVATSTQDVGEEFVDVSARVGNARRLEARFLALLERRGDKLVDVLAVERELARVREEIDRYEGRLRYLRARVALSTLVVTVHERLPLVGTSPAEGPVRAAFREAWRNFVGVVAFGIAASGVLVPVGLVAAGAWVLARRARRAARPPRPRVAADA